MLIHTKPRPFLAFGLYILSCIISGVASILLPMETKGTALKDVFDPENSENVTEMDSLLRSKSEFEYRSYNEKDVERRQTM